MVKNLPAGSTLAEFRGPISPELSQQAATLLRASAGGGVIGGGGTRLRLRSPGCELDSVTVASLGH